MSMKQARWLVATFIVLAILSFIWGRNPSRIKQPAQVVHGPVTALTVPGDCQLKGQGCVLRIPQIGRLRVQTPATIRPLEKFPFTVRPLGKTAKSLGSVAVQFKMTGMDMGFNDYSLQRQADGHYVQTIILPVCTTTRTDWVAELRLSTTKGTFVATIPFQVDRRRAASAK